MGVMAARLRRATLEVEIDRYALRCELPMVVNGRAADMNNSRDEGWSSSQG
jgi:hypothetical protein